MMRPVAIVGGTLLFAALPAHAAQPAKADKAATEQHVQDGKTVFAKWCAPCHASNPKLAGTLALQTKYQGKIPAALEERTDLTPDLVAAFVRNGVAWMAPFRKTEISDAELVDLGAYLSSKPAANKGKTR